ncbi:MAG TPA: hypothetical protein VG456_23860 [Candidatus Sulfopaludibacter sp.]|jgi:hypothetical protein|nr:hypothetical protein [Candidatus Sulfopaludibacter sp.]
MFGPKDMPNTETNRLRIRAVPLTVDALMKRPMADITNYEADVLPLLQKWDEYRQGFQQIIQGVPGNIYAVANFNLPSLEPEWCRQRINFFDMKVARFLLGKRWSKRPDSERPRWIAVPEHAKFLHYNMLFDVPIMHQEAFFVHASEIWRQVIPSGQFDVQVIGDGAGEAAAVRMYSAKTFHPRWTIDNIITSTELRRNA